MPIPSSRSPENVEAGPNEAELEYAIQDILRTADLNSVTKREIRRQLEDHFGTDLTSRKTLINATVDRLLLVQL